MGARFTSAGSQRALYTGGAPNYNSLHSMFGWVKLATQSASMQMFNVAGSSAGADWEGLSYIFSGLQFSARMSVGGAATSEEWLTTPTNGVWYAIGLARRSGTVFDFYLGTDAASLTYIATETGSVGARGASARLSLGIIGASTNPLNGSLACVRFWDGVDLSEAEFKAEAGSYTPVKTAGLYAAYRLANGTDTNDVSGNGRNLVVTNGPLTDDDDPAVATLIPVAPTGTVDAGTWLNELGTNANLHLKVSDANPATYIQSPNPPAGALVKLDITDFTPGTGPITFNVTGEQV